MGKSIEVPFLTHSVTADGCFEAYLLSTFRQTASARYSASNVAVRLTRLKAHKTYTVVKV